MVDFGRRDYLVATGVGAVGGLAGLLTASALPGRTLPEPWVPAPETWPTARFDPRNTAYNADAEPPTDDPETAWTAGVGTEVRSLAVADGTVFAGGPKALVALDAADGTEAWRSEGDASRVAVRGDTVFAGGSGGVRAVATGDGAERWRYDADLGRCYHLLPADGWLFVGGHGALLALSEERRVRWRVPEGGGPRGAALGDDRAFVGQPGPVVALESRSLFGELTSDRPRIAWERSGPSFGLAPVLLGDFIIVADGDDGPYGHEMGYVYAYDADSGERRWRRKVETNALAPAARGDAIYAPGLTYDEVDRPGVVRALDAESGETRWSTRLLRWPSDPVGAGDSVVVGGGNRGPAGVTALAAETGDRRWTVETDGDTDALAAVGDTVFAGSRAGTVYAIR